ncbi:MULTISPECIES: pantoate--beta-alanine ligase [unclassified Bradyrhizobium]|uniref:pantoate--beta-alanine ligase n=1 Tax=unclassified Bradyrhizobium TaxID=2631580 RepID=UPI0028EA077A|nr:MULTISPECIES: pantoate--beta-alanine ligase [unclassified Bradyrhizobium]
MTEICTAKTVSELKSEVRLWRSRGFRIGLVPTMGALHDGHLSLVKRVLEVTDRCVVSIFINPKQFSTGEDFEIYPRPISADLQKLQSAGAHLAYLPTVAEMYPDGFCTRISLDGPACGLEGDLRPYFFSGVATVVTKLLLQTLPDVAIFGEKDYQQVCVIRRVVRDLDIPVEVMSAPIARDDHGLALSSRNSYLNDHELRIARQLNKVLFSMSDTLAGGADPIFVIDNTRARLRECGFDNVDYVALRKMETFGPWHPGDDGYLIGAVRIGKTRIWDGVRVAGAKQ